MPIKLLKLAIVFICLALPFALSGLVLAIDDPGSDPTATQLKINRYLIEPGDVLIYGEYNIPYTSPPGEAADEAYIIRLLDADGATELGSVTPYVLFDNGYNEGAFGLYFSAADNLTWDESYTIRISQNPALFDTPSSTDYVLPLSAYTSKTTQDDNQTELAINIISLAQRLETAHSAYTLLEASAGGTVLSSPTGETYFRGAIYGIQLMAPSLFLVQVLEQDATDREWTTAQFDTYQRRFDGTWVGTDTANTSAQFGITDQMFLGALVILPLSIGSIVVSAVKYKKTEPGLVAASVFLIWGALMGWMPTAVFATAFQVMAVYLGYVWFYARG